MKKNNFFHRREDEFPENSHVRNYEYERNAELSKLFRIYDVIMHVCRMIADRQFQAPIWAQHAASSLK